MERVFKKDGFIIYKLIPCLIITMFAFMCLYGSSVYATTNVQTSDLFSYNISYDETLFENYNYIIYLCPQGEYLGCDIYISDYDISHSYDPYSGSSSYYITIPAGYKYIDSQTTLGKFSNLNSESASNSLNSQIISAMSSFNSQTVNNEDKTLSIMKRSQYPQGVFTSNNSFYVGETEVFQVPPQAHQVIVATQVEGVEMGKTLQEITGILPIVLVVIVTLIALRKGIQFLIQLLKRQ